MTSSGRSFTGVVDVTKAALKPNRFSFRSKIPRVLTKAATLGMVDTLRGFKENVIMDKQFTGTGFPMYRDIKPIKHGDEITVEDLFETSVR